MANTSVPSLSLPTIPMTLIGGPLLVYNVLTVLAPVAAGMSAYAMLQRFVRSPWIAGFGGLVFGYAPLVLSNTGHLQITWNACLPLFVLLWDDILRRRPDSTVRNGLLLGVVASLQLGLSLEVLASVAIFTVVTLTALALAERRAVRAALVVGFGRTGAVAAGTAVLLCGYPLWVTFWGPAAVSKILFPGVVTTDVLGIVRPTAAQLISTGPGTSGQDPASYLGLPLLALAGWAAWRLRRERLGFAMTVLLIASLVLSLGDRLTIAGHQLPLPLPAAALRRLPLLANLLPGRLIVFALLAAVVVICRAWDDVVRNSGRRPQIAAAIAALVTIISLAPAGAVPAYAVSEPSFFTSAAVQRIPSGSVVLIEPFITDLNGTDGDVMVWQALSGMRFRMPQGYAIVPGPTPFGQQTSTWLNLSGDLQNAGLAPPLDSGLRKALLDELHAWSVRTVIVGPMLHHDVAVQFLTLLLGQTPESVGGVDVFWSVPRQ